MLQRVIKIAQRNIFTVICNKFLYYITEKTNYTKIIKIR